jgi:hypothetical protein
MAGCNRPNRGINRSRHLRIICLKGGRRPKIAIKEAERHAAALGYTVLVPETRAPYDFMAVKDGHPVFVRVRRIKHSLYAVPDTEHSCGKEIADLRKIVFPGASRQLWVRGAGRLYPHYLVLPDTVEALDGDAICSSGQQVLSL